jgi:hypothetical protein
MTNSQLKQKPIHEVRLGRVRAAVWENASEKRSWRKVTFSRLFKDKSNQWQDTNSFAKEDLLFLAEVARQAAVILYHDDAESEGAESVVGQG